MSKVSSMIKLGGAVALALGLSSAHAALVNFSGAAEGGVFTNPTGSGNGPSLYVAQGFEFLSTGVDGHFHENLSSSDSLYLHSNFGDTTSNTWVLTKSGGGAFDLASVQLILGSLNWATDTGANGTVNSGANALNLAGIHSLTFTLASNDGAGEIGSLNASAAANAIPEPAALALTLAALGGLGVASRRRKQS